MARLLLAALQGGGNEVSLPCNLRSFAKAPDVAALAQLERACSAEVTRLLAHWQGPGWREKPELWFTYHLYYKAPDLIGPAIARALRIPYVVAEASHAGKRSRDGWAAWQAHVEAALTACDTVFCFTPVDREGLARLPWLKAKLIDLPPFIDIANFAPRTPPAQEAGLGWLITVAMMREGAKLHSYRFLAQALALLPPSRWHLDIIGDGPGRGETEATFAAFPRENITFHRLVLPERLPALLADAEIFVWPGFSEAYGLVYLEAQAMGLPVVALDCGGVASTLKPGITGLLVAAQTPEAYASALKTLLDQPALARQMGMAAAQFIHTERNLTSATAILNAGLHAAQAKAPQ